MPNHYMSESERRDRELRDNTDRDWQGQREQRYLGDAVHDRGFGPPDRGRQPRDTFDREAQERRNFDPQYNDRFDRGHAGYSHGGEHETRRVSHAGKGPKDYMRSDERIREDVAQALTDHHDIDATHIEITVKHGEVTLAGTVDDRRTKRMAEDCVDRISGVKDVQNQLRIGSGSTTPSQDTKKSRPVS